MQVVEKSNEGLSRVLAVTIPVTELNAKLDAKLKEVAPQIKPEGPPVPARCRRRMCARPSVAR